MMAAMKIQLVCLMLLSFSSWSLCSDSEEEMKALGADLLASMHTSKTEKFIGRHFLLGETFLEFKEVKDVDVTGKEIMISKASVPTWKMTLLNVCSLINNLNSQTEETGEFRDEELITRRKFPIALDDFSLEAMLTIYQIQKICHSRAFQHWELMQEDVLDAENEKNEKEDVMKRKIPYILKRQLYENKPRRPYILKRGSYYY